MLTREEIIREYAKCLSSPIYAIETYLETFDKTQEGFVPFKLFPRQKEIIFSYEKERFNLITKPRQAGVSTTTAAYLAIKAAFADDENPEAVLIIANKQELAFEFLAKIKDFVSQLPRWVWGPEYYGNSRNEEKTIFITDSKKEIRLPNGSRIKAVATSKDALRGFTPTYLVMDEAAYIDNGAIVFGAALTALGCLTKESLILTKEGLIELDELVKEKKQIGFTTLETPHKVCDMYGKLTDVTQTFVSEYGETYKIKTKLGLELEGSWKHPIYISDNEINKWVRFNELKVGDMPIVQYNQNYFGDFLYDFDYKPTINEKEINIPTNLNNNLDFAYLLGLFVAEGNFQKGGIVITNGDKKIQDFLINDGSKLGRGFKKSREYHYYLSSKKLVAWLEYYGFKKHNARDKTIPSCILKSSKNVIKSFLQGLFDGDGCSTVKEVKYSTTSHDLAKKLQILLLNFGIISRIKKENQKTSQSSIILNKEHITEIYNLYIYSNNAIKFYDEIGFRLERKQEKKKFLINKIKNKRFVFVKKREIETVLSDNKIPKYKVRFLERFWNSKYSRLTYNAIDKLNEKIKHPILDNINRKVEINKNFYVDEIIEISKSENYTYDLHVPETNSFISNGIISHNTGGKATLISTPNGMDKLYYETYAQSKAKKNNFNIIEMKWYEDLRYNKDLKWIKGDEIIEEFEFTFESYNNKILNGYKPTSSWYEEMCRGMNNDAKMIAQELDVSFIGSGGNVISEEIIEEQKKFNVEDPLFIDGSENEIWIWKKPEEGHQYIMGVDVSRGDGEDSSTIVILDFTTMEQVMEYQGKIQPDLLAQLVEEYGELYKAYTIVDITGGMGVSTVLKLLEFDYKRLHYDTPNGKILSSKQKQMETFKKDNKVPGLQVSSIRLQMISNFEEKVRNNLVKIKSIRMISEMKTFVFKNGRPDHMDGYHDDLIFAMAMCLWVLEHSFKNLERLEKQTKAMLSSWISPNSPNEIINDRMKGHGFVSNNNRYKKQTERPNFSPIVAKNMQDPTGQYMWLFSGAR
jgi:intein/homing endonuclease